MKLWNKTTAVRLTAGLLLASTMITPTLALSATVNADGSVLRVRSQASTSGKVLGKLRDGAQVEVLSTDTPGWYQITCANITGFASSDYLVLNEEAAPSQDAAPVSQDIPRVSQDIPAPSQDISATQQPTPEPAEQAATKYARVTTSVLNVRSGAGTDYSKVKTLRAGKVVEVLGETNGWYKIDSGYISAEYTVLVDADEAANAGKGQEIADFALQFVGYPYVYGGSSPKGFDCSGFTRYVCSQFGISINRTASAQLDNGTPVAMSELQPGDLVMFKKAGTGSKRASHVGIYIGSGQFVHASTSKVGVIVNDLDYAYYTTGFVGGRRLV